MTLSQTELSAATAAVNAHQRLLVVSHENIDPDGLSSALSCYEIFRALGKEVTVICPDTPPESLKFLPGFPKLDREIDASQNFVVTVHLEEGVEVDKLRYTVEDHKVNIIVVPKRGSIRPQNISLSEGEQKYDFVVVVDCAAGSFLYSFLAYGPGSGVPEPNTTFTARAEGGWTFAGSSTDSASGTR